MVPNAGTADDAALMLGQHGRDSRAACDDQRKPRRTLIPEAVETGTEEVKRHKSRCDAYAPHPALPIARATRRERMGSGSLIG